MDCLLFLNSILIFFENFPGRKSEENFFPILVESISFDAEPDEDEDYMVAFILIQTDFWKKS